MFEFTAGDRRPAKWHGRDKDDSLWIEHGECKIFLDEPAGKTQTPPSFRLPISTIRSTHSTYLLDRCRTARRSSSPLQSGSDSGYESAQGIASTSTELHITTPRELASSEAVDYRISARNYFAVQLNQPLVGSRLGSSLQGVRRRMQEWDEEPDDEKLLAYCRQHNYLDLVDNPRHATAVLDFAENARIRSLWVHAFAHCVAMYNRLDIDSEYAVLSNTTKALITRASLEMELHITKTVRGISNFLEDELSTVKLGLSKSARDHLDHFRSFLHGFFVDKFGYFPPVSTDDDHFDKALWSDMHAELICLYQYLADTDSENDLSRDRAMTGGICVFQNVQAFNERLDFEALPHPLPLLPDMSAVRRTTESQVSLRNFKLVRLESDFRPSFKQALSTASNSHDPALLERPIVQEYIQFESQKLEEKISVPEARKVRWLLIYGMTQMLASIVSAPAEVVDAELARYALCVNVKGYPTWSSSEIDIRSPVSDKQGSLLFAAQEDADTDRISIHPDCEADNAHDFFNMNRRGSQVERSDDDSDAARSPLSKSTSIRTSVQTSMTSLHRSVIGSLSRRNSIRKVQTTPKRVPSLHDMVESADEEDVDQPKRSGSVDEFDFGLSFVDHAASASAEPTVVPLLEEHQLEMHTAQPAWQLPEDADTDEPMSPISDASPRSSFMSDCDTPSTEPSSRSNSTRESKLGMLAPLDEERTLETNTPPRPGFHASLSTTSLNAGCYTPSGLNTFEPPTSKFAALQRRQVYEKKRDGPRGESEDVVSMSTLSLHGGRWRTAGNTRRSGPARRYTYSDMP